MKSPIRTHPNPSKQIPPNRISFQTLTVRFHIKPIYLYNETHLILDAKLIEYIWTELDRIDRSSNCNFIVDHSSLRFFYKNVKVAKILERAKSSFRFVKGNNVYSLHLSRAFLFSKKRSRNSSTDFNFNFFFFSFWNNFNLKSKIKKSRTRISEGVNLINLLVS